MMSQISWIFCVKNLLELTFSLTNDSISSIVSSVPEIFSFISCMLAFVFPAHLPRFSISRIPSVCVLFIASILVFKSSTVCFSCLIVFLAFFFCFLLRYSLISSNFFCLTFPPFLKGFFISSLRSFSSVSSVLGCSGLADTESLVPGGALFLFVLLHVFLNGHLPISSSNGCRWGL